MLDILFREIKCKKCGLRFGEMVKAVLGTNVHILATCENGHRILEWKGRPVFGQLLAFNLLVSAATFCSGKYLSRIHFRRNLMSLDYFL